MIAQAFTGFIIVRCKFVVTVPYLLISSFYYSFILEMTNNYNFAVGDTDGDGNNSEDDSLRAYDRAEPSPPSYIYIYTYIIISPPLHMRTFYRPLHVYF